MELPLTAAQEAQLTEIARHQGKDVAQLVQETVHRLLDEDAEFLAAVERGLAQAERGEGIDEDEMDARVARMFPA